MTMLSKRIQLIFAMAALVGLFCVPSSVLAQAGDGDVAAEVKAQIRQDFERTRESLKASEGTIAAAGSMEFWSSGGLMQSVPASGDLPTYTVFTLTPKHIKVIELPGGESAVAMYYSEGSMQLEGGPLVSHYMTRATQVFVKEDGQWKARAGHWSPISGGTGTSQSSID